MPGWEYQTLPYLTTVEYLSLIEEECCGPRYERMESRERWRPPRARCYNDIVFSAMMDHLQMAECALQNWNCQPPVWAIIAIIRSGVIQSDNMIRQEITNSCWQSTFMIIVTTLTLTLIMKLSLCRHLHSIEKGFLCI